MHLTSSAEAVQHVDCGSHCGCVNITRHGMGTNCWYWDFAHLCMLLLKVGIDRA